MQRTCANAWCKAGFEVTADDLAFYEKVSPVFGGKQYAIPPPTLCPDCRQQRRLIWQNIFYLYHRQCDATGEQIISNYSPDKPFTVYHNAYWWSDAWDSMSYGQDVEFSKPFFKQFSELLQTVPLPNLSGRYTSSENSEYINFAGECKNCYLVFHANNNEECMYGFGIKKCTDCVDCVNVFDSELLYQCVDCRQCRNVQYAQDCEGCSDSWFLRNCLQCRRCFGCMNVQQKECCIFNKQVTNDEFDVFVRNYQTQCLSATTSMQKRWEDFQRKQIHRATQGYQNENVTGDHIFRCRNVHDSFDVQESRDMKFCERIYNGPNADCYDVDQYGIRIEQIHECSIAGKNCHRMRFCALTRDQCSDLCYTYQCFSSSHLFGCIALKRKQYCILNKQYTKEEYEQLVPKIIEKMKTDVEWGEFFHVSMSPFAYNETVAQEDFPLTKEEVVQRGWRWQDNLPFTTGRETISLDQIPDNIDEVPDSIVDEVLACEATGKNYRITKQELFFYRKMRLPIPHFHPDERHRRRMAMRNPRKLWKRSCMKCGKEIETTYAPDRPETVYCEECYLKEVY